MTSKVFNRLLVSAPIYQFTDIGGGELTDALNVLVNEFNAALSTVLVGSLNYLGAFAYASLPVSPTPGSSALCTNGRKIGEGPGAGTGVLVYYSASAWRCFSDDSPVTI